MDDFERDWRWFEQTSGIYADRDKDLQKHQMAMAPAIISNLIWKLKMQARANTMTTGNPEPLLNLVTLNEGLVDLSYVPSWAKGSSTYYKKNIDSTAAKSFAQDCQRLQPPYDPYTAAAMCAACDAAVVRGALADHIKTCPELTPEGYRVRCKCRKEFRTLAALTQHRVLHCRATEPCRACKNENYQVPCQCRKRRTLIC